MENTSNGRIAKILKENKRTCVTIVVFSVVMQILLLSPSWYMLQVYDRVLTSQDENTLLGLSLLVVFLYVIFALLSWYRGLILVGLSESVDQSIAPYLYRSLLTPLIKDRQKLQVGLSDLNELKKFLTGQAIISFIDLPWVLIYLATIFMMHASLGLVAIFSVILLFALAVISQRLTEKQLIKAQGANADERRLILNAMGAVDSIQVMGMRTALTNKLAQVRVGYLDNLLIASIRGVSLSSISLFFRTLIQSVALGYGAYLAIQNEITAGMIIAGSILLGRTLAPIEGIIQSWRQLPEFKKSYVNLDEIMESVQLLDHSINLGRPNGKLQLMNVTLSLRENSKPTLDKINLMINEGECLAIIGPSGAGKTSLLKTLCGIYRPQQGQALIDGMDLAFRDINTFGEHIGYLSQTTELLAGKASENIARFTKIDSHAVMKAAKLSGADEIFTTLPEGYDTVLGDAGYGLSEGQRRKIGLARALYRDPAIVFMDEPGAGFDEVSLASVVDVIKTLKDQGVTVVFTTHQPILAKLADKVALMVNGQVRMQGPSADVLMKLREKAGGV